MAGGELGVPRGVSGIEVIGKGIIITPSSASWLGWTHRALGIPSGSKAPAWRDHGSCQALSERLGEPFRMREGREHSKKGRKIKKQAHFC